MTRFLPLSLLRLILATTVLTGLWQLVVWGGAPRYMLPAPLAVIQTLAEQSGLLWQHALVTLGEIVAGFLCGTLLGIGTALTLSRWAFLRSTVLPMLLLTQAIPVFAIAPLLVLWFGYGPGSKIVMASLIIYFPIASTCYDGLRQTRSGWLDLASTMGGSANPFLYTVAGSPALTGLGTSHGGHCRPHRCHHRRMGRLKRGAWLSHAAGQRPHADRSHVRCTDRTAGNHHHALFYRRPPVPTGHALAAGSNRQTGVDQWRHCMKKMFDRLCLAVVMAALLTGVARAEDRAGDNASAPLSPPPEASLRLMLDWYVNPSHGPIIIAQQKGFFRDLGLKVTIDTPADPTAPPKLVAAGREDLALGYQPQLHLQVDEGLPVKRVGTLIGTPLNVLMVRADSDIHAFSDLKGKRVGYSVGGVEEVRGHAQSFRA